MLLLSLSDEASLEAGEGSDEVCSLTRLIGDPEKARDKMKKGSSLFPVGNFRISISDLHDSKDARSLTKRIIDSDM